MAEPEAANLNFKLIYLPTQPSAQPLHKHMLNSSAMASLLTLPQELLAHIATILYDRTPRTGNEPVVNAPEAPPPDRESVSELSKTCRQLRSFGQAELFTSITCKDDPIQAIQLIRTLLARPDLAAKVKEIILSDFDADGYKNQPEAEAEWLITPDDEAVLNEALERFNVRSLTDLAGKEVYEGVPLRIEAVKMDKAPAFPWCPEQSAIAALAILLSPNVYNIALHSHTWTLPHFATPVGTFDHLTEITWEPGPQGETTKIDGSLEWLMDAAPNLKRFYGYIVADMDASGSHKGVTKVVMGYSHLDSTCFDNIVRTFPNMSDFTYTADSGPTWDSNGEATPAELIEALLPLKDKLTSFTLDLNFSPAAQNDDWDEDEVDMSNLSQMTALEHLSVTCMGVIKQESDDEDSESEDEDEDEDEEEDGNEQSNEPKEAKPIKESSHVKFLRSLMAPNLEALDVLGVPPDLNIMAFADIAAASYPKLKRIGFGYHLIDHKEEGAILKAYFKERGIDVV